MIFIKSKLPDVLENPSRSPSKKITKQMSAKMAKVTPDNAVDEKVINTIDLQDNALAIQFYGDNLKIAVQTSAAIIGFDVFTHVTLFKI
jgi:hypothetical protein